jgi:hypothetical protein
MIKKFYNYKDQRAIAEIIGTMLLVSIAVVAFVVIYVNVLSTPGPSEETFVTITGKIENGSPTFALQRGESLDRDTKVFINIAGNYSRNEYTLNQSFLQEYIGDKIWDIGEHITFPSGDTPIDPTDKVKIQVDATIVDTKTNAIVFWGMLLKGITTPYKGGIWHFDEPSWSGIPNEVIDSSGNMNHGIAQGGANTNPGGIRNNYGNFDGFNDSVKVDTSWTLNMSKSITVTAWMRPILENYILGTIQINETFGYIPYIIHVVGDYYVVVSEDKQKIDMIQTVKIPTDRNKAYIIDQKRFGNGQSGLETRPIITQMTESKYLVAYNNYTDKNFRIELITYDISSTGFIEYKNQENLTSATSYESQNRPSLQKINDNLCAIAYWNKSDGGIIRIVNISSSGIIKPTGNWIRYDSPKTGKQESREPYLFHVFGNYYAIAYHNMSTKKGDLKIYSITNTGVISGPIDVKQFETQIGYEPNLINISDKVFAVVYRNNNNDGCIKTFNVTDYGKIEWTGKNETFMTHNTNPCFDPRIVHDVNDLYVVAFSTADNEKPSSESRGYVITLKLEKNGSITCLTDSLKSFTPEKKPKCYGPIILPIEEHAFTIAYTGQVAHPGYVITIFYGGESQGIWKGNAFMLSSTQRNIQGKPMNLFEGRINNVTLYYNTTSDTNWHFLAITYDGMIINFYIDDRPPISKPYNKQIALTADDLYFGQNYYGYIDEIAIYEKPLSICQINNIYLLFKNHSTIPKILEYYLLGKNCSPS